MIKGRLQVKTPDGWLIEIYGSQYMIVKTQEEARQESFKIFAEEELEKELWEDELSIHPFWFGSELT
jgi:hypothetical protein